ncbi:hypothetical protein JCM8097_009374 [Rhodosporidiobolus ruineniae]
MAAILPDALSTVTTALGKATTALKDPHKSWVGWEEAEEKVDDEEVKIDKLIEVTGRMQARNQAALGKVHRVTHVKSLAFVKGKLAVKPDLPSYLRHGLFSSPKTYDVAARYANEPVHAVPDTEKCPRGLGLKVFGVEGTEHGTHDLLFNNAPMLELTDLDTCLEIMSLREKYWDDPERLKEEYKKRDDATKQLAPTKLPDTPIIGMTMYSQSAFRYGPYIARFSLAPTHPSQLTLSNKTQLSSSAAPDEHIKHLQSHFTSNPATYTLRAQFSSSLSAQPVEDASVVWSEITAPWFDLAELTFEPQETFSSARKEWWEDRIALSPFGGLEEHRPLGSINRLRERVYEASRKRRAEGNRKEVYFPKSIVEMPN